MVHVAAHQAFAQCRCAALSDLCWGMIRQPGAQAEESLRWEILGDWLLVFQYLPSLACPGRVQLRVVTCCVRSSRAGIGERNGKRLAIQVILVLGNLQSMKSSQGILKRNAFALEVAGAGCLYEEQGKAPSPTFESGSPPAAVEVGGCRRSWLWLT